MALASCHEDGAHPGREFHVIERDDGYLWAVDTSQYFAGPAAWPELDRLACANARGRVLDLGCGAGRHSLFLQTQGHDVVGLDVSAGAVAVAEAQGVRAFRSSVAAPPSNLGRFDTLLLLCNGIALLSGPESARPVLDTLAGLAVPGARLLIGSSDVSRSADPHFIAYGEANVRLGRAYGHVRLRVRYERTATEWFESLCCSPDELAALVHGSPWSMEFVLNEGIDYVAVLKRD